MVTGRRTLRPSRSASSIPRWARGSNERASHGAVHRVIKPRRRGGRGGPWRLCRDSRTPPELGRHAGRQRPTTTAPRLRTCGVRGGSGSGVSWCGGEATARAPDAAHPAPQLTPPYRGRLQTEHAFRCLILLVNHRLELPANHDPDPWGQGAEPPARRRRQRVRGAYPPADEPRRRRRGPQGRCSLARSGETRTWSSVVSSADGLRGGVIAGFCRDPRRRRWLSPWK